MANLKVETSPNTLARIGGLLYLIIIVVGIFSVAFVRAKIIVPGDVSTTADKNSFVLVLAPLLAHKIFPAILLPSFIGESSLCLWLMVKGLNLTKWNKMAGV